MWWPLLIAGSCSVGFVAGLGLGAMAYSRLFGRLRARVALLEAIRELENRRVATESGRDQLVRARAGKPARVRDGMATKPGTLDRYLRDTAVTKKNPPESA